VKLVPSLERHDPPPDALLRHLFVRPKLVRKGVREEEEKERGE